MPPFFIFLQTLMFVVLYFLTYISSVLIVPMAYQIIWLAWFGVKHNTVSHHARSYNRAGAITWCLIFFALEAMLILRDYNVMSKSYFFIMLAAGSIAVAVSVLIMACNTIQYKGEFWSSNLLELCGVIWICSQVVKGVVLSSGVPILISIGFIRFVQDGIYKEAIVWITASVVEGVVDDSRIVYIIFLCLLCITFMYVYRHTCLPLLLSPFLVVPLCILYFWNNRDFEKTRYDAIEFYEKHYGSKFPSLPKRRDNYELRPSSVWVG